MNRAIIKYCFLLILFMTSIFSQSQEDNKLVLPDTSYTVEDPDFELLLAAGEGDTSKVKALLSIGAEVNFSQPYEGVTPLMYAAQNGHLRTVEILIDSGANVNAMPYNKVNALLGACIAGHVFVADTLILNGADINTQNLQGLSPLIYAAAYDDEILLDVLLFYGADINQKDYDGNTPLMYAVFYDITNISEILLNNTASPDESDIKGFTPLMIAAQNGYSGHVELLLYGGADINATNKNNHTALSLAIVNQHYETVELLLENGANANNSISKSVNELTLAEKFGGLEILDLMMDYGATNIAGPFISKMIFATDFNWNFDDVMMGGSLSLLEARYGFLLQAGFKTRPSPRSYLYELDSKTYYQFWETRSCVHIGIDKHFTLSKKSLSGSYGVFVGLNGAYTYGNFRGSSKKPDDKFIPIPKAGFFINYNNLNVKLNYEYISLKNSYISNHRVNISLGIDINFTKHKVKLKEELSL